MNSELDEKILEVKEELLNLEVVKSYFLTKKAIEEDKELKSIEKDIHLLTHAKKFKEAAYLRLQYKNHPLIQNMEVLKDEVLTLLRESKDILEQ